MEVSEELLRRQIMISQFCNQVGCSPEQATKILQASRWQIEVCESSTDCVVVNSLASWSVCLL